MSMSEDDRNEQEYPGREGGVLWRSLLFFGWVVDLLELIWFVLTVVARVGLWILGLFGLLSD